MLLLLLLLLFFLSCCRYRFRVVVDADTVIAVIIVFIADIAIFAILG